MLKILIDAQLMATILEFLKYDAMPGEFALNLARRCEADGIEIPDTSPEAEERRAKIIELADDQNGADGAVEIDADGMLSEGDDNGCYVQGWVWADFSGTEFDKEKEDEEE